MNINTYIATVKHDQGTDIFNVTATSEDNARQIIGKAQGCPARAIISVKKLTGISVTTYGDETLLFDNDTQQILTHL